jgi:hypothetical protein
MKPCPKPGGTLAEACREIFRCLGIGRKHEWYCYECACGKWHITDNPK